MESSVGKATYYVRPSYNVKQGLKQCLRIRCFLGANHVRWDQHAGAFRKELPRHVAIIMDGNGRWAKRRGLPRIEGHRKGADSVRDITRAARELGIQALTLYAFSSQNWDRPVEEVRMLMELLRDYLVDERAEILDNDIRLDAIGNTDAAARLRARAAGRAAGDVGEQHAA